MIANIIINFFGRPIINSLLPKVLLVDFSTSQVKDIRKSMWDNYRKSERKIPKERTIGAQVMVRLAALSIALYKVILTHEKSPKKTRQYIVQLSEKLVKIICFFPWKSTRTLSNKPIERTNYLIKWLLRFPYASPGYDIRPIENGVGFNVYRCPVAEYFKKNNLSQLCTKAFCNIDYSLAKEWGVELKRPNTIVKGCKKCDFRFYPSK